MTAATFPSCTSAWKAGVGVIEILLARMNIEVMTIRFGSAVHGEVLRSRVDLAILRIVALQPLHERDAHARVSHGSSP